MQCITLSSDLLTLIIYIKGVLISLPSSALGSICFNIYGKALVNMKYLLLDAKERLGQVRVLQIVEFT